MENTEREGNDEGDLVNHSTKKVRIQGTEEDREVVMDTVPLDREEDFELSKEDVERSSVNDIPSINFSKLVNQIIIKHMEHTVVIKFLGRSIGDSTLQNKVFSLGKLSQPFCLMDVENGYFLAKFKNSEDYERPYPSIIMAWILLPGLPGHMYKQKILREIRGIIGKVAKLDFNTDNGVRGRFARMIVFVNLDRALISQVLVNDHYGHMKEICPRRVIGPEESGEGISGNMSEHRQNMGLNTEKAPPNPGTYGP
ncbi:hypothetical protein Gogos_001254 [Gossypium gossypioides]|uniref:DUF4283 domain-containing protein n=1 Tax=Gossypium gossypioides TaxID=34282 RepID=A0A7J9CVF9_GOSGO|nr:hypothetical protein [Gossypium gossypioides]